MLDGSSIKWKDAYFWGMLMELTTPAAGQKLMFSIAKKRKKMQFYVENEESS